MHLIPCNSCKNNIQSDTKFCPECGASTTGVSNSRKVITYLLYLIIAILSLFLIIMLESGLKATNHDETNQVISSPYCNSQEGMQKAKEAFNETSGPKALHFEIISFQNAKQVGYDMNKEIRRCTGDALFNTGKSAPMDYSFQLVGSQSIAVITSFSAPKCNDADAREELIDEIERKVGYEARVISMSKNDIEYTSNRI